MSVCDRCQYPGACCKGFQLSYRFDEGMTSEQVHAEMMRSVFDSKNMVDMVPVREVNHDSINDAPGKVQWSFNCKRLQSNGRCGNYKNRPQLCRDYEPLTDGLCVMYVHEDVQ